MYNINEYEEINDKKLKEILKLIENTLKNAWNKVIETKIELKLLSKKMSS